MNEMNATFSKGVRTPVWGTSGRRGSPMVANGSSRPLSYRFPITTSATFLGKCLWRRPMKTKRAKEMKLGTSDYVDKNT